MNIYDVVIVGGGAAGLSAALVLTRARRLVAVVDTGEPRNAPAAHMQGFLGSDGMPPRELLAAGRREVSNYGGDLINGRVSRIEPFSVEDGSPLFDVVVDDGSPLRTRRLIVTTGLRDEIPEIPGVRDRWGRDLLHCPYCHGHEVRDQPLGVLGGTPEAVAHAQLVRQWSADVVFFSRGAGLTTEQREDLAARDIRIVETAVTRLVVEADRLSGVELETGEVVPRTAVFVRPAFVPHDSLLTALGCTTDEARWVRVDGTGRTSVPGVWAAGNAVNPRAQVITAAGEGSAAAIAVNNDLVDEDVRVAVAQSRVRH
jgi:thioredoxin reductase